TAAAANRRLFIDTLQKRKGCRRKALAKPDGISLAGIVVRDEQEHLVQIDQHLHSMQRLEINCSTTRHSCPSRTFFPDSTAYLSVQSGNTAGITTRGT